MLKMTTDDILSMSKKFTQAPKNLRCCPNQSYDMKMVGKGKGAYICVYACVHSEKMRVQYLFG